MNYSAKFFAEYLAADLAKTLPYFPQNLCIFPGDISSRSHLAQEGKQLGTRKITPHSLLRLFEYVNVFHTFEKRLC